MPTRAVFLIHGIGAQKQGEFLQSVIDPMARYLREYKVEGLRVTTELRPEHGPASSRIDLLDEQWHVREVWWQRAFHPPTAQKVLTWGFFLLVFQLVNIILGMFPALRGESIPDHEADPVHARARSRPRKRRVKGLTRANDILLGMTALVTFTLAYVPILVLAGVFYVLALLPGFLIFPRYLRGAVVGILGWLVEFAGDQYALMFTETTAASIRNQAIEAMRPFFDKTHPDHVPCDSATVIAHSGGATAAFAVLSDPQLWQE
jgi:hypothetical protein